MRICIEETTMGYRVRLQGDDPEEFYTLLEDFKDTIPQSLRRYISKGRYWHVEKRGERRLRKWLAMMECDACADVIWNGGRPNGKGPDQRNRSGAHSSNTDPIAGLYGELFLTPGAPAKLIEAARKILAVEHHPDRGGDEEKMKRINCAYDLIRELEAQRSDAA